MSLQAAYRSAQAAARELITLRLLDDESVHSVLACRMAELQDMPHGLSALVEILIESVADQWDSAADFSAHVIDALAEDDTQAGGAA
jgi:hypothetical protein